MIYGPDWPSGLSAPGACPERPALRDLRAAAKPTAAMIAIPMTKKIQAGVLMPVHTPAAAEPVAAGV
jgi:hypothetical protein